jgi:hypothetical protein
LIQEKLIKLDMPVKKKAKKSSGPHYNKAGNVTVCGVKVDVCDCLELDCPGCFFPCHKCGSEKCGTHCRRYRRFMYDDITWDGVYNKVKKNPYLSASLTR